MLLWISFAVLTALVLIALLSPFRRREENATAVRASYDLAVYKDQLVELERDEAAGLIAATEAEAARNEVSRRVLTAQSEMSEAGHMARPVPAWISVATIVAVPVIALGGYLYIGRPDLPAQPFQARIDNTQQSPDMEAMVLQVEQHLEKEPNDARGWSVLAPVYMRMSRFADAANAYRRVIAISGPDPKVLTDLGETIVLANKGVVSKEAREVFEASAKANPDQMKARFYLALGMQQEGKTSEALKSWNDILKESPPNAPWRQVVESQITDAGGQLPKGPALTEEQMQAGSELNATDRTAMIRSMVDGLDTKLANDSSDLDGWLRLVRARIVLGEKDKAADALRRAASALKDNPEAMAQIDETRKALGL
ncbi:MAG: c-type cytochrome biogenesis protein CcmI [Anderseniella sp.]